MVALFFCVECLLSALSIQVPIGVAVCGRIERKRMLCR